MDDLPGGNGFYVVEGTGCVLRVSPGYFSTPLDPADYIKYSDLAGFLVADSEVDLSKAGVLFGEFFREESVSDIEECFASKGVQYIPLWAFQEAIEARENHSDD